MKTPMLRALELWYGKKRAAEVRYAGPFEISRYSRPASTEELWQWLPMLAD